MMSEHYIRPINTAEDYAAALKDVEALMEIEDLSERQLGDLDVLTTLITAYEDRQFPMDIPTPIEAIKFRMEQLGMSQADMAPFFGGRAKVSEVLSGRRELTLKMIRALNEHLGIPAEALIRDPRHVEECAIDYRSVPVREMARNGWIDATRDLADRAEEVVRDLIARAGGAQAAPLFRQANTARANAGMNVPAMQAWCLHVLAQARECTAIQGRYVEGSIDKDFLREVAKLSAQHDGPARARSFLADHGIALVAAKHLSRTYLDGAAMKTVEGVPVVGMTIRYDRLDNFWFCLLHELAHLGWHFDEENTVFFDDLQLREGEGARANERELEADQIAQEALIPRALWQGCAARQYPTVTNVLALAQAANVHPAIIAGRIRHERKNYRLLSQFVGANEVAPQLLETAH